MESRRPPGVSERGLGQSGSRTGYIRRDRSAFPCLLKDLVGDIGPLDAAVDKASCCWDLTAARTQERWLKCSSGTLQAVTTVR